MKIIYRQGEVRPYKLVARVFRYRRAFRWIIVDARGLNTVMAHGLGPNTRAARALARERIQQLQTTT